MGLRENHLARFIVEVIEQLDLSALAQAITRTGQASLEYMRGSTGLREDVDAEQGGKLIEIDT